MYERRKAKRRNEENEIIITLSPGGMNHLTGEIIFNLSKDISESGTRIQINRFLPVGTQLNIKVTSKNPPQMIIAVGKVKWIKSIFADELFEAGLEFVNTSRETI
jgi:hypothetical protein